jgi:hypothetical protein
VEKADATCTSIRQFHIDISNLLTPKEYVGKIEQTGIEYPESEYMRSLQTKYFPTSSWTIEEKPIFNSNRLVAWVVTGKLMWDYTYIGLPDIIRQGMMAASHQVNYKSDKQTRKKTDELVDLGNDVKAANTDTWKKALNFYLNICDDIYRWECPELSRLQVNELLAKAELLKDQKRKENIINTVKGESLLLNKENYNKWLSKIDYEVSSQ